MRLEKVRLEFEPFIGEAERAFIVEGVDYHNIAATGLHDWCPVNFVLRGERRDVLGGLLGQLWGGSLQIFHLWVAEAIRGQGHGIRLMRDAEDYARSRGAVGATLETYSFQAKGVYLRLGYEICGTLDGYPPGHAKFFLKKSLA